MDSPVGTIQNRNTLQSGSTAYIQFLYAGSSATIHDSLNVLNEGYSSPGITSWGDQSYPSFLSKNYGSPPNYYKILSSMYCFGGDCSGGTELVLFKYRDFGSSNPLATTGIYFTDVLFFPTTSDIGMVLYSTNTLAFADADDSNFVGIRSSNTVSNNFTLVLPPSTPTISNQPIIGRTNGDTLFSSSITISQITWGDSTTQTSAPEDSSFRQILSVFDARLSTASSACEISNPTSFMTPVLLCDDTTDEDVSWPTVLTEYGGGDLKVDIYYSMASATSGGVVMEAYVMCVSSGDAANIDAPSFSSVVGSTVTVPGTAGYLGKINLTLGSDSCADGDIAILKLNRDANNSGDNASGDIEIREVIFYED